jgi:hypothetical protein
MTTKPQQRLMYDECQISAAVRQSTSPIGYVLDTSTYVSCNPAMIMGVLGGNTSSRATDRGAFVNIENELQNRSRPMTRACPDQQHPTMEPNNLKHLAARQLYERPAIIAPPPMDAPACMWSQKLRM